MRYKIYNLIQATVALHEKQDSSNVFDHEGVLYKRQRGRRQSLGGSRKNLKFQPRFCVLSNTGFIYKQKKNDRVKVC